MNAIALDNSTYSMFDMLHSMAKLAIIILMLAIAIRIVVEVGEAIWKWIKGQSDR